MDVRALWTFCVGLKVGLHASRTLLVLVEPPKSSLHRPGGSSIRSSGNRRRRQSPIAVRGTSRDRRETGWVHDFLVGRGEPRRARSRVGRSFDPCPLADNGPSCSRGGGEGQTEGSGALRVPPMAGLSRSRGQEFTWPIYTVLSTTVEYCVTAPKPETAGNNCKPFCIRQTPPYPRRYS